MKFYRPQPRFELTPQDVNNLLRELRLLGFGRAQRTEEHTSKYPELDEFTYMLEDLETKPQPMLEQRGRA